ncbi:MAG TPA: glycosyltransferase family 4 protein [Phenylobacterium sp.]|uniref:glycosyltransferase family 4 protein n=1 Tax=Phenylobacterium sp. TaxID=1871053 RepID=UPI002D4EFB69|nr:glycosyltransferase family 4 protein [Phenylobacterium sp.]HZZ70072.1 glycosyltransferase family 4 protein [Phenylobacterium sp.]
MTPHAAPEITVVGYPFEPTGMAEHARSTFRAFRAAGATPRLLDVADANRVYDPDLERDFGPHLVTTLGEGVNLFGVNGDEAARVIERVGEAAFARGYNIAYPAWELAEYPKAWAQVLDRFDEIWAPSSFVAQALRGAVSKPVHRMPLPVDLKLSSFLGRRHFGIPEEAFVAVFFFDFASFADRKNPGAVLEAFERLAARRPDADIHCVIKSRGGHDSDEAQTALELRLAALGPRAQALYGDMSDNEIKNLVRVSDVFVSLHRSEGFGRGMAEAMALGRPAIATGYSGNLDFMPQGTGLLVDYELVPVAPGAYPHGEGQMWAAASPEHASRLMEQLMDDPAEARAMGARAKAFIAKTYSTQALGRRYLERLSAIGRA